MNEKRVFETIAIATRDFEYEVGCEASSKKSAKKRMCWEKKELTLSKSKRMFQFLSTLYFQVGGRERGGAGLMDALAVSPGVRVNNAVIPSRGTEAENMPSFFLLQKPG